MISARLAELAKTAYQAHVESDARGVVAGKALVEAKKLLAHGQWLPWLRNHARIPVRSAQYYMALAKGKRRSKYEHVAHFEMSGSPAPYGEDAPPIGDEWGTPPDFVEMVRTVLGGIDLDPASNDAANKIVKATDYFRKENDALIRPWHGRVFLNPPYSRGLIDAFAEKTVAEFKAGNIAAAVVLTNTSTSSASWRHLADNAECFAFPGRRIQFLANDGSAGSSSRYDQSVFYLGPDKVKFAEVFGAPYGMVCSPWLVPTPTVLKKAA